MSEQALAYVQSLTPTEVSASERIVLYVVAVHYGVNAPEVEIPQALLAYQCSMTPRTAARVCARLVARDFLRVRRGGGRGRHSAYELPHAQHHLDVRRPAFGRPQPAAKRRTANLPLFQNTDRAETVLSPLVDRPPDRSGQTSSQPVELPIGWPSGEELAAVLMALEEAVAEAGGIGRPPGPGAARELLVRCARRARATGPELTSRVCGLIARVSFPRDVRSPTGWLINQVSHDIGDGWVLDLVAEHKRYMEARKC